MEENIKVTTEPLYERNSTKFLSEEGSLNDLIRERNLGKVNIGLWSQNIYYQSQSCVHGNFNKGNIFIQLQPKCLSFV